MAVACQHRTLLPSFKVWWCRHALVFMALLLAALVRRHQQQLKGLDPSACQQAESNFNVTAVLEELGKQSALAAAAAANGSCQQQLHIVTVISSHTSMAKVEGSALMRGLPPAMRPRVKVLQAQSRIGHGLDGFGAFGAKMIEVGIRYDTNTCMQGLFMDTTQHASVATECSQDRSCSMHLNV